MKFSDPHQKVFMLIIIFLVLPLFFASAGFSSDSCEVSTNSLNFDGEEDYICLTDNIDETPPFSVSAWVYLQDYGDADPPHTTYTGNHILSRGDLTYSSQWNYFLNVNGNKKLGFVTHPDYWSADVVEAEEIFPLREWVFVTFTHQTVSGKLYQNGQLVDTNDNMRAGNYYNASPMVCGAVWLSDHGCYYYCWEGLIDDVAIYDQALTEEEIDYIYLNKIYPSGSLVAHWKFNSGAGGTLIDSFGGNDGTIYGALWSTEHRPNDPCATPTPAPTPSPPPLPIIDSGDYNGDGTSDIAIFRPSSALWAVRNLGAAYFGSRGDIPSSGDYDGDGTAEIAVFRPAEGLWGLRQLSRVYFGGPDNIPVPADYDGDGLCDVAVFRPASGLWALRGISRIYYGNSDDRPVPGDFNGDGSTEIAIFRPSNSLWAIRGFTRRYYGAAGDIPVPGHYNYFDDGEAIAVFRPSTGLWAIDGSLAYYYGSNGDMPVAADYDGDLLDDIAIFRPSGGLWSIKDKTRVYFGSIEDIPVTR